MERNRNFCFVVYPEECFPDWLERLEKCCVPAFVSPLHTPEDEKKHCHCIVKYDGKKSINQLYNEILINLGEVTENKNALGLPIIKGVATSQACLNFRSALRYLIHFDNPEKQQFEKGVEEIKCFSGAKIQNEFLDDDEKEKSEIEIVKILVKMVSDLGITDFLDFFNLVCENADEKAVKIVMKNSYFFDKCLKSCINKKQSAGYKKVEKDDFFVDNKM